MTNKTSIAITYSKIIGTLLAKTNTKYHNMIRSNYLKYLIERYNDSSDLEGIDKLEEKYWHDVSESFILGVLGNRTKFDKFADFCYMINHDENYVYNNLNTILNELNNKYNAIEEYNKKSAIQLYNFALEVITRKTGLYVDKYVKLLK